MSQSLGLE